MNAGQKDILDKSLKDNEIKISSGKNIQNNSKNILRKILGLICLLNRKNILDDEVLKRTETIIGKKIDIDVPEMHEYSFEAEVLFGDNENILRKTLEELLLSYEIENINAQLIDKMSLLKQEEMSKNTNKVEELAKECQVLSQRKAELVKIQRKG
jgi:hypothetical protein